MLRWWWLEELARRSRKVLNRRLLHDSRGKDSRKEIEDDTRSFLKDSFSMDSRGQGRRKESIRYEDN